MAERATVSTAGRLAADMRQWLGSGRVQSRSGAFCAWRDMASDSLAFEYPEITGYALTWLAALPDPGAPELDAGHRAARWLLDRLGGGDRSARAGWESGSVYTFDLGMIAAGLISFGRRTGRDEYVEQGSHEARRLIAYLEATGALPAVAPDGPPTARGGEWSTDGRAHLAKCVQSFLLIDALDAARSLAGQATRDQASDGHFVTQPGDAFVMLHPHLYAIEALWMLGTATGDESAIGQARRATEWLWEHQLPSGGLPRWVSDDACGPEQMDVTGQSIRAAHLLDVSPAGLEEALSRVDELSRDDEGCGRALLYQPDAGADHLNCWVTMFTSQAAWLAADDQFRLSWDQLV